MKLTRTSIFALPAVALAAVSCSDDVSHVGGSLSQGEVTISIDTLTLDLKAVSRYSDRFDSRAATNLLGRLSTPEYGALDCSYVTRLLPTPNIGFPATVGEEDVDSMKIILSVPRGSLAGDSVAPQQLKVYRLTRQLPDNIDNQFDPAGYYDETSLLGTKNYTISALSLQPSAFLSAKEIEIRVPLDRSVALEVLRKYREEPETFQWPASFAQWMPGVYVEHSFGRGCVANITRTRSMIYYHYTAEETVIEDDKPVTKEVVKTDSVSNFVTSPVVLSSNNVTYAPAQQLHDMAAAGKAVVTTPGGYLVEFTFPAQELLQRFRENTTDLTVISELTATIPVSKIDNKVGLEVPPTLLMVRSSEMEEFLRNQRLPDDITSFWASYDEKAGGYKFTSLRNFISTLAKADTVTEEDVTFTLLPVLIGEEQITNSLGQVTGSRVSSCTPYMASPTMGLIEGDKAQFVFTFSQQRLE